MGMVGGSRSYDGPGLGSAPWKCPRCAEENTGPIDAGCVHCGSGSARPQHVGQPPPVLQAEPRVVVGKPIVENFTMARTEDTGLEDVARAWVDANGRADRNGLLAAFIAGYRLAVQQFTARTMAAPPVTADVAELAPEGKPRRTIIAALELFKDQVLRDATEEIASGEWLSIEEVDALLQQLRDEEAP